MKAGHVQKLVFQRILIILILVSAILTAACGQQNPATPSKESAEPIKVGVLASLSGTGAPVGEQIRDGIVLAAEVYGQKVKGRPIKLFIEDTTGNPDIAVSKATKLVEKDGVVAILGISYSSEMLALEAISNRLKVPIITTNAQATDITGKSLTRWAFRTIASDDFSGNALAKLLQQQPDLKQGKWYILGSDFAYGHSSAKVAKATGINVIGEAFSPLDNTEWASPITTIQKAKPDYLLAPIVWGVQLLQFFRQANDFDLYKQVKVYLPAGLPEWQINELGDIILSVNVVASLTTWGSEDKIPALKEFNERFYTKYNRTPTTQVITSAAGLQVFLQAVEKATAVEPEAIRTALEGLPADTIIGKVKLRAEDHQLLVPMYSGKFIKLDQPKYGTKIGFKVEKQYLGEEIAPPVR
jgi:branched-chain amino acid transport system substrate-binding protein